MAKSVAVLLREAAAALERGQAAGLQQMASPSEPKIAVSEVSRLFSLYARPNVKPVGNLRRSIPPKPTKKSTCIHNFFRLNGWRDDEVPKLSHQAELEQGGLGERKIVFSEIIPCLAEKYTPKYLESYGIHKATVCVGLLQQYLSLDKIN
ncbi:hypothetical protein AOLI_G00147680 [Acnodon oligacanthus]